MKPSLSPFVLVEKNFDWRPDFYLEKYAIRVPNQPFEQQQKIHKKLVEAQDGEDSDMESDVEEEVVKR